MTLLLASPLISVSSKRIEQTIWKQIFWHVLQTRVLQDVKILYQEVFIGFKPYDQGVLLGDWFPTIRKIEMPSLARLDHDEKVTTTCRGVGDHSPNDTP
jgi:hypothetical protein